MNACGSGFYFYLSNVVNSTQCSVLLSPSDNALYRVGSQHIAPQFSKSSSQKKKDDTYEFTSSVIAITPPTIEQQQQRQQQQQDLERTVVSDNSYEYPKEVMEVSRSNTYSIPTSIPADPTTDKHDYFVPMDATPEHHDYSVPTNASTSHDYSVPSDAVAAGNDYAIPMDATYTDHDYSVPNSAPAEEKSYVNHTIETHVTIESGSSPPLVSPSHQVPAPTYQHPRGSGSGEGVAILDHTGMTDNGDYIYMSNCTGGVDATTPREEERISFTAEEVGIKL